MISFGLVAIPVALYTATQDNDIHFNQLHKEDNSRIRYKKTCAHYGKEIGPTDIVRGYEYDKDHYVVVTDDDLEKIKTEKDKSIQILHFAQLNQISPVYYEKTYQAVPEAGGEKAFELLRAALMAEQKIAIGKTVMGTKDALMAIIPRENGILISTMFFADEVKGLPKRYNKPELTEAELNMAKTLINSMDTPFNPSEYKNEFHFKIQIAMQAYPACFTASDILYYQDHPVMDCPLEEPKALLEKSVSENGTLALSRYIEQSGIALYDLAAQQGLEGVVAKRKDSLYFSGKRTKDWIKFKNLKDDDFVVCGFIKKSGGVVSIERRHVGCSDSLYLKGCGTIRPQLNAK